MLTGSLTQVHDRSFTAYRKIILGVSVNSNAAVQLYDAISVPLANVTTSTVNVSPMLSPTLLFRGVEELLRNVPAADSQLTDADNPALGLTDASSPYLM